MSDSLHNTLDIPDAALLIRERTLAIRWGKSIRTPQRWRAERYGPAFIRIGGSVLYRSGGTHSDDAQFRLGQSCSVDFLGTSASRKASVRFLFLLVGCHWCRNARPACEESKSLSKSYKH
jgi:hypothetical protein